eukprot:scaffold64371_cov67-Phaeocystis_antarctica.AAC.2
MASGGEWARAGGDGGGSSGKVETAVARGRDRRCWQWRSVAEGRRALCSLRTNRQAEQSEWLPV